MLRTILMTFILIRKVEVLKRKEIVSFFMCFLIVKMCYKPCDDKKKPALAFLNAKMVYCYDGLQTQIYLYAENIFFSFYAKSYLLPSQMGSCLASVCQVLYSNIIHVSLYVTLLFTIAIRTSLLSDWQLLLLPSNSIFKYEIRLR